MVRRMIVIGALTLLLVGCNTTGSQGGVDSGAPAGVPGTAAQKPAATDQVTADRSSDDRSDVAAMDSGSPDSVPASTPAPAPEPAPIDPAGVPLEDVMISREGLRLVYDVTDPGDPPAKTAEDDSPATPSAYPTQLTLILQPSRTARADISVHAPGAEGYLVMEETETLWQPALVVGDHPLTQALAEFAYPRYLPPDNQSFRSAAATEEFFITGVGERAWELVYDSGTTVRIGNFLIEPMALDGGGPETIVVTLSSGRPVRLTLRSAAVYREREISGAVVSAFGRPLSDVTVAPHPQVGRLPASRVAVTDAFGAFTLPYRAAPGDSTRLYYGRTTGSGEETRIANPQEIRGRVDSPDFATLIFTEQ